MSSDLVVVYSTNQEYEAELIKSLLNENEIDCYVFNKKDSSYLFGEIEIYVSTENYFIAKQLILKFKGE